MSIVEELISNVTIPKMITVRQKFQRKEDKTDICITLKDKLHLPGHLDSIPKNGKVAIAVGSRGIQNISKIVKVLVNELKGYQCDPFIVPAMGSHGGATAEGQLRALGKLGVTEEEMGIPILSSMEVTQIGELENGLPIYTDSIAYEADALIVINRVKPHTAFRGKYESGILKMLTIGLGKQKGAETCHQLGFKYMAETVEKVGTFLIDKLPLKFAIAVVEDENEDTCILEVLPSSMIISKEPFLLDEAKKRMPKILLDRIDVLVIDQIGKNISGDGSDPNITGRFPTPYASGGPNISKIVVLNLTKETYGNAVGIGMADFTTQKVVEAVDWDVTYANVITATVSSVGKIPIVLKNDELAIKAAIKTSNVKDINECRIVRIRDTLSLEHIEISESLWKDAIAHPDLEIKGLPKNLSFDEKGALKDSFY